MKIDPSLSMRANIANLLNGLDYTGSYVEPYNLGSDLTERDIMIVAAAPVNSDSGYAPVYDPDPAVMNRDNGQNVHLTVALANGKTINCHARMVSLGNFYESKYSGDKQPVFDHTEVTEELLKAYQKEHYPVVEECVKQIEYKIIKAESDEAGPAKGQIIFHTEVSWFTNPLYNPENPYIVQITGQEAVVEPDPLPEPVGYTYHDLGAVVMSPERAEGERFPNPEIPPKKIISTGIKPFEAENENE